MPSRHVVLATPDVFFLANGMLPKPGRTDALFIVLSLWLGHSRCRQSGFKPCLSGLLLALPLDHCAQNRRPNPPQLDSAIDRRQ